MKLIEAKRAKDFASTFFNDPILKMAVSAAIDNCPGFELVECRNCKHGEPCKVRDKVWCPKIGRYMKADAFCSERERRDG